MVESGVKNKFKMLLPEHGIADFSVHDHSLKHRSLSHNKLDHAMDNVKQTPVHKTEIIHSHNPPSHLTRR